ncbi:MAG TPA: c-type cytochrome, partial [Candidatus Baltobacteraceae bacterium]|nr:c-type cytochrome [Candidatus Baltobacteraceae bacterium]
ALGAHIRKNAYVATALFAVLAFTGCSKQTSTAQATPVPTAAATSTTAAATKRPVPTVRPSVHASVAVASAPVRETAAPTAVARTAKPVTPHPPATHAPAPKPTATIAVATVTGDATRGKTLYAQNCAACHGASGQGGVGPALQGESTRKNLGQAVAWIEHPQPPMPTLYPGTLSAKDVLDIGAYVESL